MPIVHAQHGKVESNSVRRVVDSGKAPTCMWGESGLGKGSKKYIYKKRSELSGGIENGAYNWVPNILARKNDASAAWQSMSEI